MVVVFSSAQFFKKMKDNFSANFFFVDKYFYLNKVLNIELSLVVNDFICVVCYFYFSKKAENLMHHRGHPYVIGTICTVI